MFITRNREIYPFTTVISGRINIVIKKQKEKRIKEWMKRAYKTETTKKKPEKIVDAVAAATHKTKMKRRKRKIASSIIEPQRRTNGRLMLLFY